VKAPRGRWRRSLLAATAFWLLTAYLVVTPAVAVLCLPNRLFTLPAAPVAVVASAAWYAECAYLCLRRDGDDGRADRPGD
jgi:hypothetical protein